MATTLVTWKAPTGRPATNFATPGVKNARDITVFDPSTNESIFLESVMPQSFAGGTLTLRLRCSTNATTGDVDIDVSVENAAGLQLSTDSFDTVNSTDNTVVPGSGSQEFPIVVTLTNRDSVAVGSPFRLRVTRDAVSDTLAAELEVYMFELREA